MEKMITAWGDEGSGGTYLLWLTVAAPVAVVFGRFQGGQPVLVPAGNALYVGSAMGGLAARLLRHATRCAGPPQPIRAAMLAEFPALGLTNGRCHPPSGKKLHWHIDYLVEETAVTLTHVLLIRRPQRLEETLAHCLAAQPQTFLIAPGLGASDAHRGGAHLLGVNEGSLEAVLPCLRSCLQSIA
jgi:Uri superfamily endonuclease